ncbi:MAG: trigger factor [Gammaproteobacteria bacterium]|nr:trigger factor [Gammaproteobacteria bacterium]
MDVSIEHTEGLERRMIVTLPGDDINEQVKTRLKDLSKKIRLDGFRPGKVPLSVVKRKYGAEIRDEVSRDLLQKSFSDAIVQENLRLAGQPNIEIKDSTPGENFQYTAIFEVYPEIKLTIPEQFPINKPVATVSDADIDIVLEKMRTQQTDWSALDRASASGDRLNIDFVGRIDGDNFEGGQAKDFNVVIGSKTLLDDFETQLIGRTKGENFTINVTFPEDYGIEKLKGNTCQFDIVVNDVEASQMPEINDDFAKRFAVDDLVSLRAQVKENIGHEVEQAVKDKVKEQVVDMLLQSIPLLDVPKQMVENEIAARKQKATKQLMESGISKDLINLEDATFSDSALRSVKLGLIISDLVRVNKLAVTPEIVHQAIAKIASNYEHPEEITQWYLGDRSRLGDVEALLLEDQAIALVLEKAKTSEQQVAVSELMNYGDGA